MGMLRFPATLIIVAIVASFMPIQTRALIPYTPNLWDSILPLDQDPFRVLEQIPLPIPKPTENTLAMAMAMAMASTDWKETPRAHIMYLDIPGLKRGDVKIEVEENRVLRVSGERKAEEEEEEEERWHRAERVAGKFWRRFRLPENADLDAIKAHLENGVLRITVPKLAEDRKRQPKVISIAEEESIKATKAEL